MSELTSYRARVLATLTPEQWAVVADTIYDAVRGALRVERERDTLLTEWGAVPAQTVRMQP